MASTHNFLLACARNWIPNTFTNYIYIHSLCQDTPKSIGFISIWGRICLEYLSIHSVWNEFVPRKYISDQRAT